MFSRPTFELLPQIRGLLAIPAAVARPASVVALPPASSAAYSIPGRWLQGKRRGAASNRGSPKEQRGPSVQLRAETAVVLRDVDGWWLSPGFLMSQTEEGHQQLPQYFA